MPEAWLPPFLSVGRKYEHAPIVEAAIALSVSGDPSLKAEELAAILQPPEFPSRREIYDVSTSDWNKAGERTASRTVSGYRAQSADESYGVVVKCDEYVFSQLSAYKDWDGFVAEAERYWTTYRAAAAPKEVTRAGVRFINLIKPPHDGYEVRDYLRTSFEVSPYLPQVVHAFFSQVEIPLEGIYEGFAPIGVVTVASGEQGIILDIAVHVDVQLDTQVPEFADNLSEILGKLRHAKNYVFESCVTDATRNVIS